jgi:predicted transcriptional regulator
MATPGYTNVNVRFKETTAKRLKAVAAERMVNPSIIADRAVAAYLDAIPSLPEVESRVADAAPVES